MFAAGMEFLSEDGSAGDGVRIREPKLKNSKGVKFVQYNNSVTMRMRYAGEDSSA